ncbi:MAG: carboxypeptidase-like regulatory domain-containing protein, partial [Planctomycetota bacterium]|nr:carboxypeptidase-like regulatory domain-containing protein [Planctomycetota bacterium]
RILILALFILVVGGLWGLAGLLDPASEEGPGALELTTAQQGEHDADATSPSTLLPAEPEEEANTSADLDVRAAVDSTQGAAQNFDLEGALWIEGRINAPGGIPADERAELLVMFLGEAEMAEDDTNKLKGLLIEEYQEATSWLQHGRERVPTAHWARRPVNADGSFRFPVPADGALLHAAIDGRYLYQRQFREGEVGPLTAPGAELVLEVETGAWLTGECTPPAAAGHGLGELRAKLGGQDKDDSAGLRGLFSFGSTIKRLDEMEDETSFEFRGLPADLVYSLSVTSTEMLDHSEDSLEFGPAEHRHLAVAFKLGARVSGRVVDESRAPLEGTKIQVGGAMAGMANMITSSMMVGRIAAETDEDGRFEIKGARPRPSKLGAFKQGFLPGSTEELPLAEGVVLEQVEIVLDKGYRIAGSVSWPDGSPAQEASVQATASRESAGFDLSAMFTSQNGSGKTDENGLFELSGLTAGKYTVSASARIPLANSEVLDEDAADEEDDLGKLEKTEESPMELGIDHSGDYERRDYLWRARQLEVAADTLDLTLFLEQPTGLAGRVVDDLGQPLASCSVAAALQGTGRRWGGGQRVSEDFDNADGSFQLEGLAAGTWTVNASSPHHGNQVEQVMITAPYRGTPLELVLPRAASVSGMVIDPHGTPVKGASIGVSRARASNSSWSNLSSDTREDGTFRLDNVGPGPVSLRASANDWADSLPLTLDLAPAGFTDDIVLSLRLGGTLTGEVFGPDGKGEPNLAVQLIGPRDGYHDDIHTDDNGWFEISHLTPGQYQVLVQPSRDALSEMIDGDEPDIGAIFSSMKMASAEIREGETTHVVLGEEPTSPVKVSGRITESGKPVSGVMVAAVSEGGNVLGGLGISQTKSDGTYKLTLKRPGPTVFSVQAFSSSDIQFFADIPAEETFTFDMALPLGGISGMIYGPGGKPLADIQVTVSRDGGVFSLSDMGSGRGSTSDERGAYTFSHLTPGEYTVRAGGALSRFEAPSFTGTALRSGVLVNKDETTDHVHLTVGSQARLLGSVTDATGQAVAGASVFVYEEGGQVVSPLSTCTSDSKGRFI